MNIIKQNFDACHVGLIIGNISLVMVVFCTSVFVDYLEGFKSKETDLLVELN